MTSAARIILALTIFLTAPAAAWAQHATVSATLNVPALQPGQTAVAAIVVDIAPGLHAQSATAAKPFVAFRVEAADNSSVEFLPPVYPPGVNRQFPTLGLLSIYERQVIVYLPMRVKAGAVTGPTEISGKLTLQACNQNICFAPEHPIFRIATQVTDAGMEQLKKLKDLRSPYVGEARLSSEGLERSNNPKGSRAPNQGAAPLVPPDATGEQPPDDLFTGFDPRVFASAAPMAPAAATEDLEFFGHRFPLGLGAHALALSIAFIIGILFNLVPCVLPVLPLKAMGFYEVSRHNRARCLMLGTVFSAGVVTCFVALAVITLGGVGGIARLGWGEQFKYAWFVWTIVLILVVMALGMFGLFDLVLPAGVYQLAPRHDTVAGNYLFGMLTAILSTPCTAPMFPGLLAWSLKQPSKTLGVLTIVMVGVGMAAPYLLLSAFPGLVKKIPRAGPWSLLVKQMMGFLILAVAVYFAGGSLIHGSAFWWAVLAVIAAAMIFLVVRAFQLSSRRAAIITAAVALLIVAAALDVTRRLTSGIEWGTFTPQAMAQARRSDKPVLVEFTAHWCPNCQTLEATVYRDPRALKAIHDRGVILLQADLTNDTAPGWASIKQFSPSGGIPLTVIYAPGQSQPMTLSSLYTTQNLLDALGRAEQ